jgi:hypothetical protein
LAEHDFFGKPVATFPDHALAATLEFERFEFDEARLRARFIAFATANLVVSQR